MIKAAIVDDEPNNIENLQFLLENDFEGIAVVFTANNGKVAREWLQQNKVDVVFLDIQMPFEDGLEMLRKMEIQNFKTIFVTAYNQYALQAFKASAVDYVLKPINSDDLKNAIDKLKLHLNDEIMSSQNNALVNNLVQNFEHNKAPTKIAIPHLGGISIIDFKDIVALQADSNYVIIHKIDMQKIIVAKTLKEFEELFNITNFLRIHKSTILNINYIVEYSNIEGGIARTQDGNTWSVSRRQYDTLINSLKANNIMFFK